MQNTKRPGCLKIVLEGTRERIMSGRYRAGERLPTETQLQEEWNVSRSVVREAMKVLESQGLVRVEQGRGTFVNQSGTEPLRQQLEWALVRAAPERAGEATLDEWEAVLDVRLVMEVAATERAARHANASDLALMQSAISVMRGRPDDVAACAEADYNFHLAIAQATRNPLWPTLLGSLHGLLRPYMEIGHHGARNALMTAGEHDAIFKAIREGHGEAAGEAMRKHLQTARQDVAHARRKKLPPFPATSVNS